MTEITNQNDLIHRSDVLSDIRELCEILSNDPVQFDQMDELRELHLLLTDGDSATGNRSGTNWTLVRDSYFQQYAENMAFDMGSVKDAWPFDHIDWARAARALQADYKQVDYDGETYWVRA